MEDSELREFESINKGYRLDVYTVIYSEIFNVIIYDLARLTQTFEDYIRDSGFFPIDSNLIIVKEVSKFEIINTINKLYEQGYFNKIKVTTNIDITKLVQIQ